MSTAGTGPLVARGSEERSRSADAPESKQARWMVQDPRRDRMLLTESSLKTVRRALADAVRAPEVECADTVHPEESIVSSSPSLSIRV